MSERRSLYRPLHINEITGEVVDSAIQVHSALGPGLLESAYRACLAHELRTRSLTVRMEGIVPIAYEGLIVDRGYRIDVLVEEAVVVEIKAVKQLHPVHTAQVLSQLKLSAYRYGLLINFHSRRLKDGITRLAN